MSREERRAYQRQMKGMDRGPALPPAAKARAERNAARRDARRQRQASAPERTFSTRFVVRAVLAAVAVGFIAFSLQWGEGMPRALYIGLAVTAILLALILGFRFLLSRTQRAA